MDNNDEKKPITVVTEFVRDNMTDLVIVALLVVYILRGAVTITATGKTIPQIIGDGLVAGVFAYVISRLMEYRGLLCGEKSKTYTDSLQQYLGTAAEAQPYVDLLGKWCEKKNEEMTRRKQTSILMRAGISYETFRSEGFDPENYDEKTQRYIRKAERARCIIFTPENLTQENDLDVYDTEYRTKSKAKFLKQSARTDFFSKLALTVMLGYYGVSLIADFNWATLIWYALQAAMFVTFGVIRYQKAYAFMTDELSGVLNMKQLYLIEFIHSATTNKEKERKDNGNGYHGAVQTGEPAAAGSAGSGGSDAAAVPGLGGQAGTAAPADRAADGVQPAGSVGTGNVGQLGSGAAV